MAGSTRQPKHHCAKIQEADQIYNILLIQLDYDLQPVQPRKIIAIKISKTMNKVHIRCIFVELKNIQIILRFNHGFRKKPSN